MTPKADYPVVEGTLILYSKAARQRLLVIRHDPALFFERSSKGRLLAFGRAKWQTFKPITMRLGNLYS